MNEDKLIEMVLNHEDRMYRWEERQKEFVTKEEQREENKTLDFLIKTYHEMRAEQAATTHILRAIQNRLDSLEEGVVEIKKRLGTVEERLETLESNVREVNQRLETLETNVHEVNQRLGTLETNVCEVNQRLETLETNVCEVNQRLETLETNVQEIKKLVA